MNVSADAIQLIKHHEGVRVRAYRCPARLWTIAVGHLIRPADAAVKYEDRLTLPIPDGWDRTLTMEEVDDILRRDLARFEQGVLQLCPSAGRHQGFLDSLVSLSFNIGLGGLQRSSVRLRHNRGDHEGAAEAFLMWTKAGGRELPGLVKRRRDERAMYLAGCAKIVPSHP
jgi:lysozyme